MLPTNRKNVIAAMTAVLTLAISGCATAPGGSIQFGEMTDEGLQRVHVDQLQYLAIHPGADLGANSGVHVEPVEIEFASEWNPLQTGSRLTISDARRAELKKDLAERFMREFKTGLRSNPALVIVDDDPGPGMLRITPRLVDVKLAMTGNDMQPGDTFSRDLGQATLELAMYDVATDTLVVRLGDARDLVRRDSNAGTSFTAVQAAFDRIFNAWGSFVGRGILEIRTGAAISQEP